MQKTTIYGLPLNPTHLLNELKGGSFCVSYATRDKLGKQLDQAIELVGHDGILMVDNGAFSHWKSGGVMNEAYVEAYEQWADGILARCPQAIAVFPDVIGGTEEQNRELILTSLLPWDRTMPVWHMSESIEYLLWMCEAWEYVGIGSTIDYKPNSPEWHARIQQAFDAIEQWERDGDGGYIRPRIHMMRAQAQAHMFDFDSSDSTNVAVNHNRQLRKAGECVCKFAARVDAKIQASCDRQEAEHQTKRPLLGHLEWAERHAALMLDIMSTAAVYGGIKCVQN